MQFLQFKTAYRIASLIFLMTAGLWAYGPGIQKNISPYLGGFGVGPFIATSSPLKDENRGSLKITFANELLLTEQVGMFFDYNYYLPDNHHGLDIGANFFLLPGPVSPLIGFGVGGHYFNKDNQKFSDSFGPSFTAHLGLVVDVNPNLRIRFRVPYHMTLDKHYDAGVGFDISLLFSLGAGHIKTINP